MVGVGGRVARLQAIPAHGAAVTGRLLRRRGLVGSRIDPQFIPVEPDLYRLAVFEPLVPTRLEARYTHDQVATGDGAAGREGLCLDIPSVSSQQDGSKGQAEHGGPRETHQMRIDRIVQPVLRCYPG